MFHTRRYVPFGGKRRPKPFACRSGGSALGSALSGRSKIGFTAQKHAPFRLWRLGKQQAVCPRLRTPLPASRSGHAGCRLFFLRCKRECGGLKPLPGAMPGFSANKRTRDVRPCSHVRMFACSLLYPAEKTELPRTIPARCRSRETKARLKVARNGAGLLANPRIGARFER